MDVLSEVLKAVKLDGAVFYDAEFSAPWSFRSPPSSTLAPLIASRAAHVIIYHLVSEGSAWARVEGGAKVPLRPGDIVIFPHGDPHILGNGPQIDPVDAAPELARIFSEGIKTTRLGRGGEVTKFVCGYMACEPQFSRVFLSGLPSLLTVNIRTDASGQWLENSIRFSVSDAEAHEAGGEAVLAKLSEALFIETLRRFLRTLPPEQTGWLAGARDAEVGRALFLLHRQPAKAWTIAELAGSVGVSRSVLAERFLHYLGEPPMSYLTRWRLQLGSRMLLSARQSVAEVASAVGYESEPAFNRAFKREFGLPPARFRAQSKPLKGAIQPVSGGPSSPTG